MRQIWKKLPVIACAFGLAGALSPAAGQTPASRPVASGDADRAYFTDLTLVTHEGKEVRFYTDVLKDRIVLINSFYTHCTGVTPRQTQVLSQLQELLGERLGRDVFIVSITVDPERDTPEKMKEYARQIAPRPGWLLLSGKPENVNWVNHKLGQYLGSLEDHRGLYVLGNLRTSLWMKLPVHAMATDLYRQVEKLLDDEGDPRED